MEQTPYWMWGKQNPSHNSNTRRHHHHQQHQQLRGASSSTSIPMAYAPSEGPSWEEQAFAEDATGAFGGGGGCVWPPRSYSCSFCRREFRSAQALGGHMNVHRRDRARLKQSSSSPSPNNHQSQLHVDQTHHLGFDHHQYHLLYQNPNHHDHDHQAPRVCDHNIIRSSPNSPTTTWANFVVGRSHNNTSEYPKQPNNNNLNCVKTDLSVSLSLVLHPAMLSDHDNDDDDEEEEAMRSCKKRKRSDHHDHDHDSSSSLFPIFLKPKIHQTLDHRRPEKGEEELDLELRLGDRPDKVK